MASGGGHSYLPGRRALAAIVFTDVAGFSALVQQNEVKTLALVNRDIAAIRKICQASGGRIVKTTGDGVRMYFDSAVHAVSCAVQVQAVMAKAVKDMPADQVLQHRIGIHLGDVFVSDTDVLGDGVNVASRLQAEAQPGGICISQTVYDVVKNRMSIQAVSIGPRDLKNISEAVNVYQILVDAQRMGGHSVASKGSSKNFSGRKFPRWAILASLGAVAAILLIGIGLLIALLIKPPSPTVVVTPPPTTPAPTVTPSQTPKPADKSPADRHPTIVSALPATKPVVNSKSDFDNLKAGAFVRRENDPVKLNTDKDGWIDLLATVDPQKDCLRGQLEVKGGKLLAKDSVFIVPVDLEGSYHIKFNIVCDLMMAIDFPVGQIYGSCLFRPNNGVALIVGGPPARPDSPDGPDQGGDAGAIGGGGLGNIKLKTTGQNKSLEIGKPQTIDLAVKVTGEQCKVTVTIDGTTALDWSGKVRELGPRPGLMPVYRGAIMFCIMTPKGGSVTSSFSEIRGKMLDGKANDTVGPHRVQGGDDINNGDQQGTDRPPMRRPVRDAIRDLKKDNAQ